MIAAENPDVALAVGDLIQSQEPYREAYEDFHQAWGVVLGDRIASTLGNHDYYRDGNGLLTAEGYFGYWQDQNAPTWRYGRVGEGWSSWDAGKWHMVNLNSNCRVSDCSFTGAQLRWLINDLKRDRQNPKTQCTLAYFHHPLFSAGIPGGRSGDLTNISNLWEILYRYRTDLVVTGHQHFYERYLPQDPSGNLDPTGITQIISGTGGASTFPTEDEEVDANNSARALRMMGATFLNLGDGGYSTYFRDRLGRVHDPMPVKPCLDRNAGQAERTPRARRYTAHMKRMANLKRRIKRLGRNIRKMSRNKAPRAKIRRYERRRAGLAETRRQLRDDRLY